jgi:hypothetical protein
MKKPKTWWQIFKQQQRIGWYKFTLLLFPYGK